MVCSLGLRCYCGAVAAGALRPFSFVGVELVTFGNDEPYFRSKIGGDCRGAGGFVS